MQASPLDLRFAVATSCNAYFCYVFRDILDNRKYESVKDGYDVLNRPIIPSWIRSSVSPPIRPINISGKITIEKTLAQKGKWYFISWINARSHL